MVATTCPVFTAEEWAERLLWLFPKRWSAEGARDVGAGLFALFEALGSQYSHLQEELLYAFNASRIGTATDEALDRACEDFFGATTYFPPFLVRANGEPDESFRARIFAAMFVGGGNRKAITTVIERLTGSPPRIIEPWNIADCAVIDGRTFIDVDTVQNPSRISDTGLRATVLIETKLGSYGNQGDNPVYGMDAGTAVDFGYIIDPQPTWFQGIIQMDQLLNTRRTLGVNMWRRYQQVPYVTYPIGNTVFVPPGSPKIVVDIFPKFDNNYVILAQPSWNTSVYFNPINNGKFELIFSTPPDVSSPIDWCGAPLSVPGFGQIPVVAGDPEVDIGIPASLSGSIVIARPHWNSGSYLSNLTDSVASYILNAPPADLAFLSHATFPPSRSGEIAVPADAPAVAVGYPFGLELPVKYGIFVTASWNTNCWVTRDANQFLVSFNVPPPVDSKLYWGLFFPGN